MPNVRRSSIWLCAFAVMLTGGAPLATAAERAREGGDCAVASRRFDLHAPLAAGAPERVGAPGGGRLHRLVAAPCGRGPVAREV